jgi:hypothetical protein
MSRWDQGFHVSSLPGIERGRFLAFFTYDVADTIDLSVVRAMLGRSVARAPLRLRRQNAPEFVQYSVPPLVATLPLSEEHFAGWDLRAKIFDYGVISFCLSRQLAGPWDDFSLATCAFRSDSSLVAEARGAVDRILDEVRGALDDPHPPLLEVYFVIEVERFTERVTAQELLETYRSALAALVLGENRPLASSEQHDVLRTNFAYYEDELVVVGWETAFVYDASGGAAPIEDILEFANTQLVELRTYDGHLDAELDAIYKHQPSRLWWSPIGNRVPGPSSQLRYLIVDVRELSDRSRNTLKFIGDAYFARLYRGAVARFGLEAWQRQLDEKLRTIAELYRFAEDRAQHLRDNFLEIIIILLIVIEVVIGFLTLRSLR